MPKNYLSDILILLGCIAITTGAALISPVLALFVGGGFCLCIGVGLALYNWSQSREQGIEQ